MEVMKQLDQGEIAATARARLHGDMVTQRNDVQVPRPQAPRPVPPPMNPAFSYPGEESFQNMSCKHFALFVSKLSSYLYLQTELEQAQWYFWTQRIGFTQDEGITSFVLGIIEKKPDL